MGEPCAVSVDGVRAYKPDVIAEAHKKFLQAVSANAPLQDPTMATVISALQAKWCMPGKVFNL
eukprot:4347385-Pyramimonas_sp.AAC.1